MAYVSMAPIHYVVLLVTLASCYNVQGLNGPHAGVKDGSLLPISHHRSKRFADSAACHLHVFGSERHEEIRALRKQGVSLFKYNITIPEYEKQIPLSMAMNNSYRAHEWYLTQSDTQRSQLLLGLRFDVLSLGTLNAKMESFEVAALAETPECLAGKTEQNLTEIISWFILRDLIDEFVQEPEYSVNYGVCHRKIEVGEHYTRFPLECCMPNKAKDGLICEEDISNEWINALQYVILALKVFLFLFGPHYLIKLYYAGALDERPYVIPLKEKIRKTVMIKKVRMPAEPKSHESPCKHKRLQEFGQLVKTLPGDEVINAKFNKLHILVDQGKLIGPQEVPFGIFSYLYQTFIRCKLARGGALGACCRQSLFGSWSPRFLCIPLKKEAQCNDGCKSSMPWEHIFRTCGALLLMAALPIPFYLRLWVYYTYEEEERKEMQDIAEGYDSTLEPRHDLIQTIGPEHVSFIITYTLYIASFILLALLRACSTKHFDKYIARVIADFRAIDHKKTFEVLISHILLPFDKFGLICGLPVAALYWPFALPVCLLVILFYNVPLVYLCGRLVIHGRPSWCSRVPKSMRNQRRSPRHVTEGVTSPETYCMLDKISPSDDPSDQGKSTLSMLRGFLIGTLCVILLLSVQAMFAECIGFAIEVIVVATLGTFINADRVINYVILLTWTVIFFYVCYSQFKQRYINFSKELFVYLQSKLVDELRSSAWLRKSQRCTAFKITHFDKRESLAEKYVDNTEYIKDALFWKVYGLSLFVDHHDNVKVHRQLFEELCKSNISGCPGKMLPNLLRALRRFIYAALFVVLIFVGLMAFGEEHRSATLYETIILIVAGAVPFALLIILSERKAIRQFSFEGVIQETICSYQQVWPLFDLNFIVGRVRSEMHNSGFNTPEHNESGAVIRSTSEGDVRGHRGRPLSELSSAQAQGYFERESTESAIALEPTHIDLLLTVRDETKEEQMPNSRSDNSQQAALETRSVPAEGAGGDRSHLIEGHDADNSALAMVPLNTDNNARPSVRHVPSNISDSLTRINDITCENNSRITSHQNSPSSCMSPSAVSVDCVVDMEVQAAKSNSVKSNSVNSLISDPDASKLTTVPVTDTEVEEARESSL